jgi:hypothetical protein
MKFLIAPTGLLLAALMLALAACDKPESAPEPPTSNAMEREHTPGSDPSGHTADLRARAAAAFSELGSAAQSRPESRPNSRSESRIGPQPWPQDLPQDWPRPASAQLLADSRTHGRGRLLLADLPGTPEQALDSFQWALVEAGFAAQRRDRKTTPPAPQAPRVLHVRRGAEEAILTFIDRDPVTRLEILFIDPDRG